MRVLVADKFEQSGLDGLKAAGCEVIYQPDAADATLVEAVRSTGADVLVVRSSRVTEEMLQGGKLALVVRAGAGYNTIDVAAASRRGIYVSNCPGRNSIAVAELAFALILALDRRIPDNVIELRQGRWNKKEFSKARGLHGRTLALLGVGHIGREMVRRAQAFGMNVVVWSRRFASVGASPAALAAAAEDVGFNPAIPGARLDIVATPVAAAARADVLSVHVALTPDTRGLVGDDVLGQLRPGSSFVNTARAEVVDQDALARAVKERDIRVALDVFAREPAGPAGAFDDPIVRLPNVYGTHHIGASTDQAQEAIAAETVRIVRTYMETGRVPNVVNLCRQTPASHMLVVRHRDRPGVLAHVFDHLRAGRFNVQETENIIFEGAQAAVARINLDGAPPATLLKGMREGNPDILDLHLVALERSPA